MTTTGNGYNFYFFIYINAAYGNEAMSFWLLCEVIFAIFNETTAITTAVCKFFASKQGTDLY